mmetsp:Transcript_49897/g.98340  ORF Transcript_49897/g.98340 Transcript_49897/m.98340 type:complete len:228 (+) Transcript_49897:901-1584(+)
MRKMSLDTIVTCVQSSSHSMHGRACRQDEAGWSPPEKIAWEQWEYVRSLWLAARWIAGALLGSRRGEYAHLDTGSLCVCRVQTSSFVHTQFVRDAPDLRGPLGHFALIALPIYVLPSFCPRLRRRLPLRRLVKRSEEQLPFSRRGLRSAWPFPDLGPPRLSRLYLVVRSLPPDRLRDMRCRPTRRRSRRRPRWGGSARVRRGPRSEKTNESGRFRSKWWKKGLARPQ